jgi:tetratricopeptide (TPR) repeat protein
MSTEHATQADDDLPEPELLRTSATQSAILTIAPKSGDSEAAPAAAPEFGVLAGYELREEIGRGGMGIVYSARDVGLNREVAVKILRDEFSARSGTALRFVEEGRITGQLQHPGIPAIHQVGTLSDGRPFLAMRLIKGKTLDELMKEKQPSINYLAVFESVCQAVAYAHAHRVIHRDLKPANVMVGAFGEVQVMDWGLAKVLSDSPVSPASEPTVHEGHATEILSRRDSDGSFTQAGSIMGTPAFMPPEQAGGEVERVDRRADVFSLGAILCVMLTGKPPFRGKDRDSIRLNAVRGKLGDAFARLDRCGAESELIALAKQCLAVDPDDRPPNAGELADAVHALRAAADERAKKAEMEQARVEVRAIELRKRRRVQLALAVSFLLIAVGAAGAIWWHQTTEAAAESVRASREAKTTSTMTAALDDAQQRAKEAWAQVDDPERMHTISDLAVGAVRRAEGFAATGEPTPELRRRLVEVRAEIDELHRHARLCLSAERTLEAHAEPTDGRTYSGNTADRLREAYLEFGIDSASTPVAQAVKEISASPIRNKLLGYLRDWHFQGGGPWVKEVIEKTRREAGGVLAEWQLCLDRNDHARLVRLSTTEEIYSLGAQLLCGFGHNLESPARSNARLYFLRNAVVRYPSNAWLRYDLWRACVDSRPPRHLEAIQQAAAMAALRPKSAQFQLHLGEAFESLGDHDRAIEAYHHALRLVPNFAAARINLGRSLSKKGELLGALDEYRKAVKANPKDAMAHNNLGYTFMQLERWDEAVAALKKARSLDPSLELARRNLMASLLHVVKLQPKNAAAHSDLGIVLLDSKKFSEAETHLKEAVRLDPESAQTHCGLAELLVERGDILGAIEEFRHAVRLDPKNFVYRHSLGLFLSNVSRYEEAEAEFKEASRLDPASSVTRLALAKVLFRRGDKKGALAEYKSAFPLGQLNFLDEISWHIQQGNASFALEVLEAVAEAHPTAVDDRDYDWRYHMARASLLAANGKDVPMAERAALRKKALHWLSSDLEALRKLVTGDIRSRIVVHAKLEFMLVSSDFDTVRDGPIELLPLEEQNPWKRFWIDLKKLRDETAAKGMK